ncbi:O-antigen ligase family protein [Ottowia testudinis]|uniref:O-antigen ligase family protein n=1 Tax=Ottowia testudinis TaxID=2816950 RepID=A0A975H3E0_9BURK|nr:O-antigen ligase family protein [Ottowia testudinis]QTD45165.1 O-antigen ligase family protein [Ottowia testudinis]
MTRRDKIIQLAVRGNTAAAFLLPALALWVPSGYSYAALLMLLGAVCFAPAWLRHKPDRATWGLAMLMVGMGCMWFMLTVDTGVNRWDKGLKWLLGAWCLLYLTACPPRPQAFLAGLPIGCAGMGLLALWQVWGLGMERATGYTNAIQWGNLALLLACLNAVSLAVFWRQHGALWRAGMALAVTLSLAASLLSQSRGGWLALAAIFPLWLWLTWRLRRRVFGRLLAALGVLLLTLMLVLSLTPRFNERIALAAMEISAYLDNGKTDTSLGLRLAQYRLAAQLIPEKPWLGWGARGFVDEMQRRVDAGEYGSEMMQYPQIHNDFLDAWVKVGLGGVLWQAALFAWVLAIFWPSPARMARHAEDNPRWREALTLRVMGAMVPVSYFMFGMSQPFFNHNSGIMCFVFYVTVLWAALQRVEREGRRALA